METFFRKSFFICGYIFNGASQSNIKLKWKAFTIKSIKQIMLTSLFTALSHAFSTPLFPLHPVQCVPTLVVVNIYCRHKCMSAALISGTIQYHFYLSYIT